VARNAGVIKLVDGEIEVAVGLAQLGAAKAGTQARVKNQVPARAGMTNKDG
jgi:hypothetical protein